MVRMPWQPRLCRGQLVKEIGMRSIGQGVKNVCRLQTWSVSQDIVGSIQENLPLHTDLPAPIPILPLPLRQKTKSGAVVCTVSHCQSHKCIQQVEWILGQHWAGLDINVLKIFWSLIKINRN